MFGGRTGLAALRGRIGLLQRLTLPAVLHQVASVVAHGGTWVGPRPMQRLMQGLATCATRPPNLRWTS
jgi:hypothetical protein